MRSSVAALGGACLFFGLETSATALCVQRQHVCGMRREVRSPLEFFFQLIRHNALKYRAEEQGPPCTVAQLLIIPRCRPLGLCQRPVCVMCICSEAYDREGEGTDLAQDPHNFEASDAS